MDDTVDAMSYKIQSNRATLSADVYTLKGLDDTTEGERLFDRVKVSRVFRGDDDVLTIEARDILTEELHLVVSELDAQVDERLNLEPRNVRLSWD